MKRSGFRRSALVWLAFDCFLLALLAFFGPLEHRATGRVAPELPAGWSPASNLRLLGGDLLPALEPVRPSFRAVDWSGIGASDAGAIREVNIAIAIGQSTAAGLLSLDASSIYWGAGAPPTTRCAGKGAILGDTTGAYTSAGESTLYIAQDCAPSRPFTDAQVAIQQVMANADSYPTNMGGESFLMSAVANGDTAFVAAGYAHALWAEINAGMGGQSITCTEKGAAGTTTLGGPCNAYASILQEVTAWATNAGLDAGVPVRVLFVADNQGEADCTGNWVQFGLLTFQELQDLQADLVAITHQKQAIVFLVTPQASRCVDSFPSLVTDYSTREQWRITMLSWNCQLTVPLPDGAPPTCAVTGDGRYWWSTVEGTHYDNGGEQAQGADTLKWVTFMEAAQDGGPWPHPALPISTVWDYVANTVTITYALTPDSTSLVLDPSLGQPHCDGGALSIWCNGYGFGISSGILNDNWPDASSCAPTCGLPVPIVSTTITAPNVIQIAFGDAGAGNTANWVSYAMYPDNPNPSGAGRTGTADNKDGRTGNVRTNAPGCDAGAGPCEWAPNFPDLPVGWGGCPLDGGTCYWDGGPGPTVGPQL